MPGAEARPCRGGGTYTHSGPLSLCVHLPTEGKGPLPQEEVGPGRQLPQEGPGVGRGGAVPVTGAWERAVAAGPAGAGQDQAGPVTFREASVLGPNSSALNTPHPKPRCHRRPQGAAHN